MVTANIFHHRNTTSYIFALDPPAQKPAMSSPMAERPSVVLPTVPVNEDVVQTNGEDVVEVIISSEADAGGTVMYMVRFGDGGEFPVSERASRSEISVN